MPHRRIPDQPHLFRQRAKGSPEACEVCGGTFWDRIHVKPATLYQKPVPGSKEK